MLRDWCILSIGLGWHDDIFPGSSMFYSVEGCYRTRIVARIYVGVRFLSICCYNFGLYGLIQLQPCKEFRDLSLRAMLCSPWMSLLLLLPILRALKFFRLVVWFFRLIWIVFQGIGISRLPSQNQSDIDDDIDLLTQFWMVVTFIDITIYCDPIYDPRRVTVHKLSSHQYSVVFSGIVF